MTTLVCIDNIDGKINGITKGNKYDLINIGDLDYFLIRDDTGRKIWYKKEMFITLEKLRNRKIKKIVG